MMQDEDGCYPFSITVRDRFGDFGLVNVVILRRHGATLEIDCFVMSCRVLSRGVEQLAMNKVFREARRLGCERVVGRYIETAKNGMVKNFFDRFGFDRLDRIDGDGTAYDLDVEHYVPHDVYIREMDGSGEGAQQ